MNFRFKLSRRLARIKLAVAIAGTLVLGCTSSTAPKIIRIQSIHITPDRASLLPSQVAPLTISLLTNEGTDTAAAASVQGQLVWSTTGGTIANNGLVAGVRHVSYTSPTLVGSYLFVVTTTVGAPADTARIGVTATPVPVAGVAVVPDNVSIAIGDTITLHATLTDETGAALFGRTIDWSTSDAGVATVINTTGYVRAMAAGTATITATSEGHSGTAVVTVHP